MTEKEEKAIEIVKNIPHNHKNIFMSEDLAIAKVLNIIQKQQEYIEDANDITTDMGKDIKKLIAEIEVKDKIIDTMAIKIHTLDEEYTKYCDGKSNGDCEILHCKDCIKRYYREKVEEVI